MPIQNIENPKITDFSYDIFGGVLVYDGAGFYPGLELLNLIFLNSTENFLPDTSSISFYRHSMDFARKLVWDDAFASHPLKDNILYDDETKDTIAKLLECLQLDIPNVAGRPAWHRAHFFPYTKNLIHYDARKRRSTIDTNHQVEVERKYIRGAGALAFKVLRFDDNKKRKHSITANLSKLFEGTEKGALDRLAEVFKTVSTPQPKLYEDEVEKEKCRVFNDEIDHLLRDGVQNILTHTELSSVKRIKSIVNWIAIWLLILQSQRCKTYNVDAADQVEPLVIDLANKSRQLRRAARSSFDNVMKSIDKALDLSVQKYNLDSLSDEEFKISKKGRNDLKGFFASSAATLGILNSNRGRRHFTLKVDALETLVLAGVEQNTQIPFDDFLNEWLGHRCNFLIGKKMAENSHHLRRFDGAIFEDNEVKLSEHLLAAGLLAQYSDATRMVGVNYDN